KRGHRGEISTADEANDQPLARNGPESLEDKIITIIKTMDSGSGVSLEDIVNSLEKSSKVNIDAVENLIFDLQMQGTIFEPSWRTYKYSS
ncbi:MAG TPA: hypothetical protein VJ044_00415, partial [Candidatus Hodarchaeales archaeon]|nr:hypothetical protein [Candidatus Hodarchaeales archaeon]